MNCSIAQYNNELYSVQRLNVQSYKDQSDHHTLALQKWKKIFSEKMEETFLKSLKLFLSLETVFSPSNYRFKTEIQVLDLHVRRAFPPSPFFFYYILITEEMLHPLPPNPHQIRPDDFIILCFWFSSVLMWLLIPGWFLTEFAPVSGLYLKNSDNCSNHRPT